MDGYEYQPRWVPIEKWLTRRQERGSGKVIGYLTPATSQEILALRRRKSGPGVSHHTAGLPRHRRSA